jgi:hypothetical protein
VDPKTLDAFIAEPQKVVRTPSALFAGCPMEQRSLRGYLGTLK